VKYAIWLAIFAGVTACNCTATTCPGGQAKDGSALVQQEQHWAKALEQHDSEALGCILADEFQDFDPGGIVYDRADTLAGVPHRRPGSNQLSELQPHAYGDIGYIRGLATLVDAEGKVRARVRFTDIYLYREGRWQAVAGQESLVADAKK